MCAGPADDKLLIDLFHKGDEFIIAGKGRPGVGPHAGNGAGSVQVGRTGALGGGHDFGLQGLHAAAIVHSDIDAHVLYPGSFFHYSVRNAGGLAVIRNERKPSPCAGHLVGQVYGLFHTRSYAKR